ncbi:hypothetical protein [Candidatus Formimonas warabiya]|uniref:Uncharacterized protein n=1 Tax=Formimonas warabiya TaxID=1761012 RepID=A0A3G1KVM1_FORW1|nr:hypothetical protein [Candidatus Formimonas warabiya]ATW26573.1 hypothetical protein DCMF_19070 [Candidatus Formimonas warabiya]
MTEMTKAEIYLTYLDQILAGEKDIGPVEDTEVAKLLQLAQSMITADFSVHSEIRETLRKQLLDQISPEDNFILADILKDEQEAEDELTEEELMYAAAGLPEEAGENICPRCGARMNKMHGKCPVCRY